MDPEFTLIRRKLNPSLQRNVKFETSKPTTPTQPIQTKNSFELLSDDSENEDMDTESTHSNKTEEMPTTSTSQRNPNGPPPARQHQPKIPPIVLHGNVSDTKKLKAFVEGNTKNTNYEIQYAHNRTTIFVKDIIAWKSIKENLKLKSFNFHSFTKDDERTHAFVLCGLSKDVTLEELETELKKIDNLRYKKGYKMNNTYQAKFLIITDRTITEKSISNIRVILNTRIKWQRYHNNRTFIQCHRCQQWGHATSNCFATPNCLKCAEHHLTNECQLPKDEPPKCINCKGAHPANSRDCPVYQRLLENYQKRTNPNQTDQRKPPPDINNRRDFRPLPTPTTPMGAAWTKSTDQGNSDNITKSDYDSMMDELQRLNRLIDMKEFTKNLRKLNDNLENCRSASDRFKTMVSFYGKLDQNSP